VIVEAFCLSGLAREHVAWDEKRVNIASTEKFVIIKSEKYPLDLAIRFLLGGKFR
jgi:hypothetical protein